MSGKKKKKSDLSSDRAGMERAAVRSVLAALREPTEDSDLVSLSSSLLQLASTDISERKMIVHSSSGGVDVIIKTLQRADDPRLIHNLTGTLDCLAKHRYSEKLVRLGVLPVVFSSMASSARCAWCTDDLLHFYHSLLLQLASKDKRFAIKSRLSGCLPVTVGLLKRSHGDHNSLHALLGVLKIMATNGANAVYLGKHGCLSVLSKLLEGVARKNYIILKLCAEVLIHLLKQKSLHSRPSAQSCVGQLVSLHQHCHLTDKQCRHLALRRALLHCLHTATSSALGCDAFHKCNGLEVLYSSASQLDTDSEKSKKSLATLTCTVLRRALPKVPLPISSTLNPVQFCLPDTDDIPHESEALADRLTSDLSNPLHTTLSAPQLTLQHITQQNSNPTTKYSPTSSHLPLIGTCQHHGSASEEQSDSSVSDREPPTDVVDSATHSEIDNTCLPETLTLYDKFFPELKNDGRVGITKVHSSPQLSTTYSVDQEECRLGEEGGGGRLMASRHSSSPTHTALLVIPTAQSLGESGDDRTMITELIGGTSSLGVSDDDDAKTKSVLPFTEIPSPHTHGHEPTSDPEPLYKKVPSVERYVTLADTARFVVNRTLNRTVYDLDSMVDTLHSSCDSAPNNAHGAATPDVQRPPNTAHGAATPDVQRPPNTAHGAATPDIQRSPNTAHGAATPDVQRSPNTAHGAATPDIQRPPNTAHCAATPDIQRPPNTAHGAATPDTQMASMGSTGRQMSTDLTARPETQGQLTTASGEETSDCAEVDHTLLSFESQFECGNLRKAIQVRPYEYDLVLNSDINSNRHHQWFYFKVSNMVSGQLYRFNIVNCEKTNSQFNYGMQPVLYSEREALEGRPGWTRVGAKVTYYKNNYFCDSGEDEGKGALEGEGSKRQHGFYTLSFTLSFPHSDDNCYLAYHYPYSFSMLMSELKEGEERVDYSTVFYTHQTLCHTLRGNPCPLITITSHTDPCDKEYVVLSARVHPGESNSSWIMRGVLQYLLSNEAEALRDSFIFKVIPMLNPDGVINGSHRCSLSGQDLNRQWIAPSPTLHPTIYHTKAIIHWLVAHNRSPIIYCDFHGHSRRKNIFMYGCENPNGSTQVQVLPNILDGLAPAFSKKACRYAVEKSKAATARVVVCRRMGIPLSYTMESTYCGTDHGPYKGRQITTADLEEMGHCFCQALSDLRRRLAEQDPHDQQETQEDRMAEDAQSAGSDSATTDAESSSGDNDHSS